MKKLLVVVDFQKDFVDGALGFKHACLLEEPIAEKILKYRRQKDEIVFTFDTHDSGYLNTQEGSALPIIHCVKDTEGFQLYGKICNLKQKNDICFYKPSFGSLDLLDYLRERTYESIEFVGLVSNICVLSNAVLAKTAAPETPVIVDAACTGCMDDSLNNAALDVMESIQIKVINR